jgi:hypothetical protein
MDNAATAAVGHCDNAPIFRLAFILFSLGRSVSVGGSDIGSKILNTLDHRNRPRIVGVKTDRELSCRSNPFRLPGKERRTKWLNQRVGKAGCPNQKAGKAGCLNQKPGKAGCLNQKPGKAGGLNQKIGEVRWAKMHYPTKAW